MKAEITPRILGFTAPGLVCRLNNKDVVGIYMRDGSVVIVTNTANYRIGQVIPPAHFNAVEWITFQDTVVLSND